jgi:hypothetical protein
MSRLPLFLIALA